jgi:hypothetical protein
MRFQPPDGPNRERAQRGQDTTRGIQMAKFLSAFALAAALSLGSSAAIAVEHAGGKARGAVSSRAVSGPFRAFAGAMGDVARAWGLSSPHHRRAHSAGAAPHVAKDESMPLPKPKPDAVPSAQSAPPTRSAGVAVMPPAQSLE